MTRDGRLSSAVEYHHQYHGAIKIDQSGQPTEFRLFQKSSASRARHLSPTCRQAVKLKSANPCRIPPDIFHPLNLGLTLPCGCRIQGPEPPMGPVQKGGPTKAGVKCYIVGRGTQAATPTRTVRYKKLAMDDVGHAVSMITYMIMPCEAIKGFDSTAILCPWRGNHS